MDYVKTQRHVKHSGFGCNWKVINNIINITTTDLIHFLQQYGLKYFILIAQQFGSDYNFSI